MSGLNGDGRRIIAKPSVTHHVRDRHFRYGRHISDMPTISDSRVAASRNPHAGRLRLDGMSCKGRLLDDGVIFPEISFPFLHSFLAALVQLTLDEASYIISTL